jgi:putative transposase
MRHQWFDSYMHGRHVVRAIRNAEAHATTLAFVVMPDHLHWLMQLGCEQTLSGVVRAVKSSSSRTLNRTIGRSGRIWTAGFHDHALRKEEDVKRVARYVIANPLRAGLVEKIGDYPLWDAAWL